MLDNKVCGLSILYGFLGIFFAVVIIIPFRVVYQLESFSYFYIFGYDSPFFFLIPDNIRIIMSRGFIPFVAGLVLFAISLIIFIKFNNSGSPRSAKFGYFFVLCSAGLLILSVIINYVVYSNRIISYTPLLITVAISLTEINIGTLIFIRRNELEIAYSKPTKARREIIEEKKIKPITPPEIKTILSKEKIPTTEKPVHFCPYCGFNVGMDHNFCRKCGRALE